MPVQLFPVAPKTCAVAPTLGYHSAPTLSDCATWALSRASAARTSGACAFAYAIASARVIAGTPASCAADAAEAVARAASTGGAWGMSARAPPAPRSRASATVHPRSGLMHSGCTPRAFA